jgi:hypothetical protein
MFLAGEADLRLYKNIFKFKGRTLHPITYFYLKNYNTLKLPFTFLWNVVVSIFWAYTALIWFATLYVLIFLLILTLQGCTGSDNRGVYRSRIDVQGPKIVSANESFTLRANLSVEEIMEVPSQEKKENSSQQLYAAMRLQSGPFGTSSAASTWEKKLLNITPTNFHRQIENKGYLQVEAKESWLWTLVPQQDRFGNQEVLFEAIIYDFDGQPVHTAEPLIYKIQVSNPLGLPPWLIYFVSIIGGLLALPLGSWAYQEVSLRLKEKREQMRQDSLKKPNNIKQKKKK